MVLALVSHQYRELKKEVLTIAVAYDSALRHRPHAMNDRV